MKPSFDRLARIYRALEFVAFGYDLESVRFHHLARLSDCQSILIAGEGDGRCLERLLSIAPAAHFTVIDLSAGMIARAQERIAGIAGTVDRVTFIQADLKTWLPPTSLFDAVVTLFVLDCFDTPDCERIVDRLASAIAPEGWWLWADFGLPSSGWTRWRAQIWVRLLYLFFRWQAGLKASSLPPAEEAIGSHRFSAVSAYSRQRGLLRSVAYRRSASPRPDRRLPV